MRIISKAMRMFVALALIVAMVFTYSFSYSYAATDSNYGYVNSSAGLNVRKGPSTNFGQSTMLKNNSKVTIYEEKFVSSSSSSKSKIWLAINSSKNQYVRSDYIDGVHYSVRKGVTTVDLNYRKGAGVGMKRAGTFKKGQKISVVCDAKTHDNHSWYKVKVGSKYYYVSSKYVTLNSTSTPTPTPSPTKPEDNNNSEFNCRVTGSVNASFGLNVRKGPATNYAKVGHLSDNLGVNIYSEKFVSSNNYSNSYVWLKIDNTNEKYVRSDFVDKVKYQATQGQITKSTSYKYGAGDSMKNAGTFKTDEKINVVCKSYSKENTLWYKVKVGSKYYYVIAKNVSFTIKPDAPVEKPIEKPDTPVEKPADKNVLITEGKVNASYGLNVRKGPSVGTSQVGSLTDNQAINIYEEEFVSDTSYSQDYVWLKIDNKNDKYVRSDYVDNIVYHSTYGKTTTYLNYRIGAGTKMTKVGMLEKDKTIEIVAKAKSNSNQLWYKIKHNGLYYYVSAEFVDLNDGLTPEEPSGTTTPPVMQEKEFEAFMTKEGFPESYKVKLRELHAAHPSWVFYAQQIKIPYESVIDKEAKTGASSPSLISYIYPDSYKSVADGDYAFGKYTKTKANGSKNGVFIYNNAEFAIVDEIFTSDTAAWSKVEFNGQTGYIESSDIRDAKYKTVQGTANIRTNVRKGASTKTAVLGTFPKGEKFEIALLVTASNGTKWYKIKYGNSYAYIHEPNLDIKGSTSKGTGKIDKETYISHDAGGWKAADRSAVSYYMDPRNFLNTNDIYMFEDLAFHPEYQTEELVGKIISGTQLSSKGFKASWFVEAGQKYKVSPVHLAARAKVETGGGSGVALSGTPFNYNGGNFSGIYNPYNIGASSCSNPVLKGLYWAATGTSYQRPWNDKRKSVIGGAQFISSGYINNNQNSMYTQKFNVANGLTRVATHQYMTNITAPLQESAAVRNQYKNLGITNETLTFIIPVYQNMPTKAVNKPTAAGNNNCFMSMISVDGYEFTKPFDKDSTTYTLSKTLGSSVSSINIKAYPNAKDAVVSGAGVVNIKTGKNEIKIKVNSSSGKIKTYTIIVNKK